MINPDLHPLPITPNDPLSIFSNKMKFGSMDPKTQEAKFRRKMSSKSNEDEYDMEIIQSEVNHGSLFESALPSLKLNSEKMATIPS